MAEIQIIAVIGAGDAGRALALLAARDGYRNQRESAAKDFPKDKRARIKSVPFVLLG